MQLKRRSLQFQYTARYTLRGDWGNFESCGRKIKNGGILVDLVRALLLAYGWSYYINWMDIIETV